VVGAPSRDNGIGRGAANPVVRVLEGSFTVHRYASDDFITISQHGGAGFSPLRSPHVPGTALFRLQSVLEHGGGNPWADWLPCVIMD
jgi:hypothetical protein